jgi:enoyl-CoA hydratase
MVNRVVPRAALLDETLAVARRIAEMPRFGLALAKRAVNAAEDRMGLRDAVETAFALHHLAHAHNLLTSPDHLGGEDARSLKRR